MRTERDDPAIAHFTQADTIVPGAGNPAAWNRYAYTLVNPLRYTDPSGHFNEYVPDKPDFDPDQYLNKVLRNILENIYEFKLIGSWSSSELDTICQAVLAIQTYINDLGKSGMNWIKTYLSARFVHGNLFGNHFVTGNTIHFIAGSNFDKYTVVHEFGHVMDNYIGNTRQPGTMSVTIGGGIKEEIPNTAFYDATIFGGGAADDLFYAMGGVPRGLRFMNGDNTYPYMNNVGVMATLTDVVRFPNKQYGNHCSAVYFAETWKASILSTTLENTPPDAAMIWMYDFISGLN